MRPSPPGRDALDLAHLARQTFDDRSLQDELLALFEQQCLRLAPILSGEGAAAERADAAHTLRGAAGAVGAFRVAALAALIEQALDGGRRPGTVARLVHTLFGAIGEVRCAMALRWRDAA